MGAYAPVTGSSARTIIAWINADNTTQGTDGRGSIVTYGGDTNGERFRLELVSGEFGVDVGKGQILPRAITSEHHAAYITCGS
jgi:hypothetical protein